MYVHYSTLQFRYLVWFGGLVCVGQMMLTNFPEQVRVQTGEVSSSLQTILLH